MMFYTYIHYRRSDKKPFYIGKGQGDRYKNVTHRNKYWKAVAVKHGVYCAILAKWDTEEEAYEHEKFLIETFRLLGFKLANLSTGGEGGATGVPKSEKHREKIGAAHRGRSKSPEQIELMRQRAIVQFSNPSARELARKNQLGKKQSAETSEKKRIAATGRKQPHLQKEVLCITTGQIFESAREAARQLNLHHTLISMCCRGKQSKTGEMTFRYTNV